MYNNNNDNDNDNDKTSDLSPGRGTHLIGFDHPRLVRLAGLAMGITMFVGQWLWLAKEIMGSNV